VAVAYVWADLAGDLEGCSWHCVWNPGTAGSRLLPMRNQFQFRAGSPPAMPAGREGRAPRPEITWQNEQASQRYHAHVLPARSFNPSNVYGTHEHG